jgi:hypothetical protein
VLKATIDSIQGDSARVLIGDEMVAVAISLRHLPPATHEGTVLRLSFNIDQAATLAKIRRKANKAEE